MAQEITQGLFNNLFQTKTPRMRSQSSSLGGLFQQQPITLGRGAMTPMSALTQRVMQSGEQLQGSIRGLFGQQTPEQAQKTAITQLIRGNPDLNLNEPEGLRRMAKQAMNVPGLEMFGIKLREQADILQEKQKVAQRTEVKELLGIENTKLSILKARKDLEGGTKLIARFQEAAAKLNFPIYQTLEEYSGSQRKAMAEYLESDRQAQVRAAKEAEREEKRELRQGMKIDAAFTTVQNLNDVIAQLEREEKEGGLSSAGLPGQLLSWIGGTKFKNLAESLKTIKANIGFDQLAFLKEASETGGALGQVSNFELESLQAVRGSLDQTQSPAQLLRNIKRVKETYGNYLRSVYNNPKVSREAKAEAKILMGRLGITDFRKTTEGSQLILKYDDANAKILMDSFGDAMRNLREDKGSSVVNQELNDNKYTTTDILKTVERKLIKEGRIKLKGQ